MTTAPQSNPPGMNRRISTGKQGGPALIVAACLVGVPIASPGCSCPRAHWYKGNTHAHTQLCGHADSTPEEVARWYLDRDYNFLCLSEHNVYIDPATVPLPADRRSDFILIPGQEVTGPKTIHTTALNTREIVPWSAATETKTDIIQSHTDLTIHAGGTPILNHPNFGWAVTSADILPVTGLHHFELYNGHPQVHNDGDENHPGTEEIWDALLTAGMFVYGVSSDDMHQIKTWGPKVSNPGRGWVMVRAAELTPDAVTAAMRRGDFYASSGVMLRTVRAAGGWYEVVIDAAATRRETASTLLIGRTLEQAVPGYRIEAIGPGGNIVGSVRGTWARFRVPDGVSYLRCRASYTRAAEGGFEEFNAWTQPVFTDERNGPS